MGRKEIACNQSQTFYRTLFAQEQGAIVQFDWLLTCQSKGDIRHLSFMHNPTSGTQQEQNTVDTAESCWSLSFLFRKHRTTFCKMAICRTEKDGIARGTLGKSTNQCKHCSCCVPRCKLIFAQKQCPLNALWG